MHIFLIINTQYIILVVSEAKTMNSKQLTFKKERPLVLGEHTPLSIAQSSGKWKGISYLKDNHGMLPPNMIVVGDRRRVLAATKHLFMPVMLQLEVSLDHDEKATLLKKRIKENIDFLSLQLIHLKKDSKETDSKLIDMVESLIRTMESMHKVSGKEILPEPLLAMGSLVSQYKDLLFHPEFSPTFRLVAMSLLASEGRVDAAVGLYIHNGKPLPITVLETQMGMSAQDINAWEQMAGSLETGYMISGNSISAKSINVIRAGTCGGIIISENGMQKEEPFLTIGDVIIASSSIADGATVRQRAGFWTAFDQKEMNQFRQFWASEGLQFTEDGLWPVLHSSRNTIDALDSSCRELKLRTHHGANMSKDSLYLEGDEERTMGLRRLYYCLSTEMEHFGLAYLTHELTKAGIPSTNGLVSTVVGTVPGGSFAQPGSEEEKTANKTQSKMLEAVMRALWKMAYEP